MSDAKEFVAVLIAASAVAIAARWARLSYTLALLLFGLGLGALHAVPSPDLSSEIILLIFLPPLLFEAAFVLDLKAIWNVRIGVSVLAIPGVLIAMLVGGAIAHITLDLPWSIALLFGAMIAATDPVAVLATFRQLGVERRLAVLLEGESLLNDGVALILLVTLVHTVDHGFDPLRGVGLLTASMVGGVGIGIALGWLAHLLIAQIDDHLAEMTVSVLVAYGAFLSAE